MMFGGNGMLKVIEDSWNWNYYEGGNRLFYQKENKQNSELNATSMLDTSTVKYRIGFSSKNLPQIAFS